MYLETTNFIENISNIDFILSLYNILSNIKLSSEGHEYTYEIHATLR